MWISVRTILINISGKSPGDLVPKFQLCAGPRADPWGSGRQLELPPNEHDSAGITLHLSLLSICLQTPTQLPTGCSASLSFKKKKHHGVLLALLAQAVPEKLYGRQSRLPRAIYWTDALLTTLHCEGKSPRSLHCSLSRRSPCIKSSCS